MSRLRKVLSLLALVASPLAAQQHPNKEHGFAPEKAYHLGEIDSVNLFNGGLVVTLPVGQSLPVAADLSFGLTLVYNSSLWEWRVTGSGNQGYTVPSPQFNAGLGWRLSPGELLLPNHPSNHTGFPIYVGPDGAQHPFADQQGLFKTLAGDRDPIPPLNAAAAAHTRDGSYLRLSRTPTANPPYRLEHPGGLRDWFDASGLLVRRENRSGVGISFSYTAGGWVATDAHGREVEVIYDDRPAVLNGRVVAEVKLPGFDGLPVSYTFEYENRPLLRGCPNDHAFNPIWVPLLTRVNRPDGTRFDLPIESSYHVPPPIFPTNLCSNLGGLLQGLTLPALGRVAWDWQETTFPSQTLPEDRCRDYFAAGASIHHRRLVPVAEGAEQHVWTYTRELDQVGCPINPPPPDDPARWVTVTVRDPLDNLTEHHFSASVVDDGAWKADEYGLPITHAQPGSNGRLLSKRIRNDLGTLLRSEYLSYRLDVDPGGLPGSKHQVAGSRTVFHDDGNKFVDRAFTDFDGLGHFRTMTHTDDFGLGGSPHVETTAWNPTRGSQGSWTPPGTSEPWILEVYTERKATENGASVLTEPSFDADGRLACERRRLSATARDAHDVVVTYTYDAAGNPIQEKWHGGDLDEVGTAQACSVSDPPSTTINHTWTAGVRSTTQHSGANFKSLDRTIHAGTGLVASSRDVSGLVTTYNYDAMGRVTKATPPDDEQPIHFTYHPAANPDNLAWIRVFRQLSGQAVTSDAQFLLDDFGRLVEERRLQPGGWSRKKTNWEKTGWKKGESEWQADGTTPLWTAYQLFDPFGRPGRVRPPDSTEANRAHDVTIDYSGTRVVSRTVKIGTGRNATTNEPIETAATTTERYDGQGRLAQVVEPAGANGADTTTTYGYDCAGRLRTVSQVDGDDSQTRTFTYDGRGFLVSEQHPEKGATGNGTVTYSDFDARGKAHRKVDGSATLDFVYDVAERLTEVHEVTGPSTTRPLKVLTYGASNANGNWALGKLQSATRYNYVDLATLIGQEIPKTYQVTESSTYAGLGGRLSSRLTEVLEGTTPQASFQLAMEWDDLGQRIGLTYPACTACGVTASRLVDNAYSFGYLTAISSDAIFDAETTEGIETQVSYHPNGLVHLIQHDSGRKETHTADPTGPARPGRIEVLEGGTTTLWTTGDYRYDGAGNIVEMGDSWYRYDGVSRLVEAHVSLSPTASGSLVTQSYEYDAFGNLQDIDGSPGRATPTSKVSNRLESGVYDNRGNLTGWISTTYRYDALGSMWRTTAGAEDWVYLYNADGERILAKKLGGDTHHRWSLRDTTGQVLRDYLESGNPVAWSVEKDYLYRGDKLLASESPAGITEYHLDHLGTPRAISKNGGSLTFHTYFPFGEEAGPSLDLERMKFTGHERDLGDPNSTGDDLDYMHARFCSPVTGRFLSVDPKARRAPLVQAQRWNRFAYALGNPLKFIDPDGEDVHFATKEDKEFYEKAAARNWRVRFVLDAFKDGSGRDLYINRGDPGSHANGTERTAVTDADMVRQEPRQEQMIEAYEKGGEKAALELADNQPYELKRATVTLSDQASDEDRLHEFGHVDQALRDPERYMQDADEAAQADTNERYESSSSEVYADQFATEARRDEPEPPGSRE